MRLIVPMLGFFVLAQVLGMFAGTVIWNDMLANPYVSGLVMTSDADEPMNAVLFIAYILAGALLMVVFIRLLSMFGMFFRLVEFVLVSTSSSIVFYAFFRSALGYEASTIAAIIAALAFAGARFFAPPLKNAAAIFATAGVGVVFGVSLGLLPVIAFLVLLSVYDFLSVFATKHMVEMANFIIKQDLAFTVTARGPPPKPGMKEQRIDLGTGDMIAPIMVEVSAMQFNPVASAFVFVGAVASMAIFLSLVWEKKMVLPALPPIVFGMIAFLLLGFLLGFY